MKIRFLPAVLLVSLISVEANAQTIMDALSTTYNSNPDLRAQRAYLRSIDENVAIAKSGYRPSLYLQGGYSEGKSEDKRASTDYDYNGHNVSANIDQPIFSGFSTVNSVKSADSLVRAEQYNLYNVEQQIFLDASTAYLDVVRDAAIVDLQKNNEKLLKKRLDETVERFNVGEVTRTDVAQSKARYSKAQADRINAEGILEISKSNYERIIGEKPLLLSEPENIQNFLPQTFDDALNYTVINNFNVKQAKNRLNSKIYDVAANTGALLPTIGLSGTASNNKQNTDSALARDSEYNNYEAGVSMRIPLYDAGADRARIRQSKYQKWQAQEQVMSAERQAVSNVTSSWEYMLANKAQISSIKDQVKANEIALDGAQKEEALGNRTVLDVLNAYQELLNSNVEEVKARHDYYLSSMQLLLSMGRLTAKDLALDVELYNAKQHSKETRNKWLSTDIGEN